MRKMYDWFDIFIFSKMYMIDLIFSPVVILMSSLSLQCTGTFQDNSLLDEYDINLGFFVVSKLFTIFLLDAKYNILYVFYFFMFSHGVYFSEWEKTDLSLTRSVAIAIYFILLAKYVFCNPCPNSLIIVSVVWLPSYQFLKCSFWYQVFYDMKYKCQELIPRCKVNISGLDGYHFSGLYFT